MVPAEKIKPGAKFRITLRNNMWNLSTYDARVQFAWKRAPYTAEEMPAPLPARTKNTEFVSWLEVGQEMEIVELLYHADRTTNANLAYQCVVASATIDGARKEGFVWTGYQGKVYMEEVAAPGGGPVVIQVVDTKKTVVVLENVNNVLYSNANEQKSCLDLPFVRIFTGRKLRRRRTAPRICCLLYDIPFNADILDPALDKSYKHKYDSRFYPYYKEDQDGLVYTCRAGFIDVSHLRDHADLTLMLYAYLQKEHDEGDDFSETISAMKTSVKIKKDIPPEKRIEVARAIAYDHGLQHEIESYWPKKWGQHQSSFSPEDLVSNLLGTYFAKLALAPTIQQFENNMETHMRDLLPKLGVVSKDQCIQALQKIVGAWISGEYTQDDFLRRRNFAVEPVNPWMVKNFAPCAGQAPSQTEASDKMYELLPGLAIPADAREYYDVTFGVRKTFQEGLGKTTMSPAEFPAEIERIKNNAKDPERYGPLYDRPY